MYTYIHIYIHIYIYIYIYIYISTGAMDGVRCGGTRFQGLEDVPIQRCEAGDCLQVETQTKQPV